MPMFEYRCPKCGEIFERFITGSADRDAQRHYPCGVIAVRQPSAGAFAVHGFNAKNGYSGGGKHADVR